MSLRSDRIYCLLHPVSLSVATPASRYRNRLNACLVFWFCFVLTGLGIVAFAQPAGKTSQQLKDAPIIAEMNDAIAKVNAIVNQRVTAYKRVRGMRVSTSTEGWFHEGAIKPDFDSVDVRQTQEFPYANSQYVTSSLNPGVVFLGNQLEFNSMTKYFYTDRTVPKKKLTDAEMQEINRLYRIVGSCEKRLNAAGTAATSNTAVTTGEATSAPGRMISYRRGTIGILVVVGLYILFRIVR